MTRAPKTQRAIIVDLSANVRAVVYGPRGAILLLRSGREPVYVSELELQKLNAAREAYLPAPKEA
jgi:hypothetical protein